MPSRQGTIAAAQRWFDDGHLLADLRRRVAYRTESQRDGCLPDLRCYLTDEIGPSLVAQGFAFASSKILSRAPARSCSPSVTRMTRCRPS